MPRRVASAATSQWLASVPALAVCLHSSSSLSPAPGPGPREAPLSLGQRLGTSAAAAAPCLPRSAPAAQELPKKPASARHPFPNRTVSDGACACLSVTVSPTVPTRRVLRVPRSQCGAASVHPAPPVASRCTLTVSVPTEFTRVTAFMSVTATVQENLFKVESRQTVTTAGSRCVVSEQPEFLTIAIAFVCADRAYSLEK